MAMSAAWTPDWGLEDQDAARREVVARLVERRCSRPAASDLPSAAWRRRSRRRSQLRRRPPAPAVYFELW